LTCKSLNKWFLEQLRRWQREGFNDFQSATAASFLSFSVVLLLNTTRETNLSIRNQRCLSNFYKTCETRDWMTKDTSLFYLCSVAGLLSAVGIKLIHQCTGEVHLALLRNKFIS